MNVLGMFPVFLLARLRVMPREKVVVVGSSGRKLIDEKQSMSTPCPAEPSAQPLLALNVKPFEAESEKENQIRAPLPPVPVETPVIPISAPVAVSNTPSVITIRPKVRPEENSTDTVKITKPSELAPKISQQCNPSSNNNPRHECNSSYPHPVDDAAPLYRQDPR